MHRSIYLIHTAVLHAFFYNTGGVDYTPKMLSFMFATSSQDQVQCEQMSVAQDGLDEPQEDFRLKLTHNGNAILPYVHVSIVACKAGGK